VNTITARNCFNERAFERLETTHEIFITLIWIRTAFEKAFWLTSWSNVSVGLCVGKRLDTILGAAEEKSGCAAVGVWIGDVARLKTGLFAREISALNKASVCEPSAAKDGVCVLYSDDLALPALQHAAGAASAIS
jgi:hypothetical protein